MSALRSVSRASALRFEKIPSFFFGVGGTTAAAAGVGLLAFGVSSIFGFGVGDGRCCCGSTLFCFNGA